MPGERPSAGSAHGAVYQVIDTVTTDGAGAYRVKERVLKQSRFRVSVPATDACTSAQSDPRGHPHLRPVREQIPVPGGCRPT